MSESKGINDLSSIKAIETVQTMAGVLGMGQYSNQAAYGTILHHQFL
jgi:hypothetical protein